MKLRDCLKIADGRVRVIDGRAVYKNYVIVDGDLDRSIPGDYIPNFIKDKEVIELSSGYIELFDFTISILDIRVERDGDNV